MLLAILEALGTGQCGQIDIVGPPRQFNGCGLIEGKVVNDCTDVGDQKLRCILRRDTISAKSYLVTCWNKNTGFTFVYNIAKG